MVQRSGFDSMISTPADEYDACSSAQMLLDEMKGNQQFLISEFQTLRDTKALTETEYNAAVQHLRAITDARHALEKILK